MPARQRRVTLGIIPASREYPPKLQIWLTTVTNSLPVHPETPALMQCAIEAARTAGHLALDRFASAQEVARKSAELTGNIVTQVDLLAERSILDQLRGQYPSHNVISEESPAVDRQSAWTWVVDPIDGTLNYAYGLANWCVSIGLLHAGRPYLGVIFDPLRDELFAAAPGAGATLNGQRIGVAGRDDLAYALVGFDLGYYAETRQQLAATALAVLPQVQALRLVGSAALSLANVAAGRFGGYFHLSLFQWDLAAALSLIREAGGVATRWSGEPATHDGGEIVAAPPGIHEQLRRLLVDSLTGPPAHS